MDNNLDISVKIWTDYYDRASSPISEVKLMREVNDLCRCFGIPKEVSEIGRRLAENKTGDKYDNRKK